MRHCFPVLAVLALACLAGDWPGSGLDPGRTRSSAEVIDTPLSTAWTSAIGAGVAASPAVAEGFVVVAAQDGTIRACREADGVPLWSFSADAAVIGSPAIDRGRVYAAITDGSVVCLDLASGSLLWTYFTSDRHLSSPAVDGGVVYFSAGPPGRHLHALDAETGAMLWTSKLKQVSYSSAALSGGVAYIGDNAGNVRAVNASSGSTQWMFKTGGTPFLSPPVVSGDYVFFLPGREVGNFYRIHKDTAQWFSRNTHVVIQDPAPPAPGGSYAEGNIHHAVSAPTVVDGHIAFLMRFDYVYDDTSDWEFLVDLVVMREFFVGIDPDTMTVAWQTLVLEKSVTTMNDVPQLSLCPAPARFETSGGAARTAVASSIDPNLRVFDAGSPLQTLPLDAPTLSSPALANGRVFAVSASGTLYAFAGASNSPPLAPVTGSPEAEANVASETPTISWSDGFDPDGDPLTYLLRVDTDGEVLVDWLYEYPTASTSIVLPSTAQQTRLTWSVRSIDDKGAYSAWSTPRSFWVMRDGAAPEPPTNLVAAPGESRVDLSWTASASADVKEYRLAMKQGSGAYTPFTAIGNVNSYAATGLTNGTQYSFRLIAVDYDGLESSFVEVSATPQFSVSVNGTSYPSITAAAAAANPGETVTIGYGTFTLQSSVELKDGVSLVGQGPHLTILDGHDLDRIIRLVAGSGTASVRMLTLSGANVAVDVNDRNVDLLNVVIRHNNYGLLAPTGSTATAVHVTFYQNDIFAVYAGGTVAVRSSIFIGNETGVRAEPVATVTLTYNDMYGNTLDCDGAVTGTGSISADVAFLAPLADDFRVPSDAATVDAADPNDSYDQEPSFNGNRANMGAYGNTQWAATTPMPAPPPSSGNDSSRCGILGMEPVLLIGLLALLNRRRKYTIS